MGASILSLAGHVGYPTLVLLVLAESAGAPVPGETSLIAAAVVAAQHRLQIGLVVAFAAGAAILGDNVGYLIGRKGGRRLLERPGAFQRQRRRALELGERFFARHGPKAVSLGRWVMGLRTWAAWLAGVNRMPWRSFLLWNAIGSVSWATTVGLTGYFVGQSGTGMIAIFGVAGLVGLLVVPVVAVLRRRSRPRGDDRSADPPDAEKLEPEGLDLTEDAEQRGLVWQTAR